jgi:hypothetical protein
MAMFPPYQCLPDDTPTGEKVDPPVIPQRLTGGQASDVFAATK